AKKLGPCLHIPYFDAEGDVLPYARIKPDRPLHDKGGKKRKYESPKGKPNRVYIPPGTRAAVADPSISLRITEGEKKAAKADQVGFPCLGLVGIYGWNKKRSRREDGRPKGDFELNADMAAVAWDNRTVFIVYDADAATNQNVLW